MRKGKFEVLMLEGITADGQRKTNKKTVSGYCGQIFGVYNNKETLTWDVTHYLTGGIVCGFELLKYAKNFINRADWVIFPVAWDNPKNQIKDFGPNLELTRKIALLARVD